MIDPRQAQTISLSVSSRVWADGASQGRDRLIVCDSSTGLTVPEVQARLRGRLEGDAS